MSGITVLSHDRSLEATFVSLYGRTMAVRRVWSNQWRDPAEITMDGCAANPELLVIGRDVPFDVARHVVAEVDRSYRATTSVVLVDVLDIDESMELLRLGARDVLLDDENTDRLRSKMDPIVEIARDRHQRAGTVTSAVRRRVITVLSPKGGTGKTTVSSNLAIGLARRLPKQTLLVDLDLQFGDCAPALGMKPEHSLTDVIKSASLERSALKVFLTNHESGLLVLPPPEDLVAVDHIDGDDLKRTMGALIEEYPFVVIDTAAGIDSATLSAMELSTDLLFVTTIDVPSILAVQRQLAVLDRIGFTSQRRTLVLNRANAKVGLSVDDVETTIGLEVKFQIPSNRLIPVSTNEGSPIIEKDSGGLARRFDEIAEYFAPSQDDGSPRSLLRVLRKN
jgi:pilus assembly protein CpaE